MMSLMQQFMALMQKISDGEEDIEEAAHFPELGFAGAPRACQSSDLRAPRIVGRGRYSAGSPATHPSMNDAGGTAADGGGDGIRRDGGYPCIAFLHCVPP